MITKRPKLPKVPSQDFDWAEFRQRLITALSHDRVPRSKQYLLHALILLIGDTAPMCGNNEDIVWIAQQAVNYWNRRWGLKSINHNEKTHD